MVTDVGWWSEQALAVMDRRGFVYVLQMVPCNDKRMVAFRQILATETPFGKGIIAYDIIYVSIQVVMSGIMAVSRDRGGVQRPWR